MVNKIHGFLIRFAPKGGGLLRGWLGVALTIAILVIIHLATITTLPITPSVALAFIPLAYTAYHYGLRPAVIAATLISLYSLLSPDFPIDRALQVAIAAAFIAVPMGVLKKKAVHAENIDANIIKMALAIEKMDKLRSNSPIWHSLPPEFRQDYQALQHLLGDITTITQGFRDIKFWQEQDVKQHEIERAAEYLESQERSDE